MIKRYISAKSTQKKDLQELLDHLSGFLHAAKVEVEAALNRCSELTMLCDTVTDSLQVFTILNVFILVFVNSNWNNFILYVTPFL